MSSDGLRKTVVSYEIYIRVPYGSDGYAKGLLSLHSGQTDNWAFFDAHVENKRVSYVQWVTPPLDIWYLYW